MQLSRLAVLLVLVVIILGAWTRLRDAGLGCPDWPTCYGHYTVPTTPEALARASALYPGQVVDPAKAWPETIHRFFAAGIGFVILVMAGWLWTLRRSRPDLPWRHALALLLLVSCQGGFGALTVTEKLYPPVVTTHLLLGFATLTGLVLLSLRLSSAFASAALSRSRAADLRPLVRVALVVLLAQIFLGGWTAANYAAAVCTDLPICQPGWQQAWSPAQAFALFHPDDRSFEFAPHLDASAKVTIHAAHRIGAMITTVVLLLLVWRLWSQAASGRYRGFAMAVAGLLLLQLVLGVINVKAGLPLWNAVAHNLVAALLLQVLVMLAFALHRDMRRG